VKNGLTVSHGLILVQYSYLKFLLDAVDLSVVMVLAFINKLNNSTLKVQCINIV